jgi:hypothetical protein
VRVSKELHHRNGIIRIIKSRKLRWAGHVVRMGERRNAYRLLVRKPEGKRPLGRPKRVSVDNIKMDVGETGWGGVEWIGLAQDRVSREFGIEPSGSINCWEAIERPNNLGPLEWCAAAWS